MLRGRRTGTGWGGGRGRAAQGGGNPQGGGHGSLGALGECPDQGANALLALAHTAIELAGLHDPGGADRLSVVPTVVHSGQAFNVVPAEGELIFDMRADTSDPFQRVLAEISERIDGVTVRAQLERVWPGMDSRQATQGLLEHASGLLGRRIVGVARGGASDASHFAPSIPLTVDGLGPRGGGAHTPHEFVLAESLGQRAQVAVAVALAALSG